MNINLIRFKGVIRELRGIRLGIERLADCWETELAHQGLHIRPPIADTRGEAPELLYTDEEDDALKELEVALGKRPRSETEEGE